MASQAVLDTPVENDIVSHEDRVNAEKCKETANGFFKAQDYQQAITHYTEAIRLDNTVPAYFTNRALAYIRTECFGYALEDANKAIQLDQNFVKAYYRRACSHMALGKFKLALRDFEAVTKVKPNDKDAKKKFKDCEKIVRMKAFEKAIAVESKQADIAFEIEQKLSSMQISDDYSGPHLVNGQVTAEFMEQLLEHFKNQKVLHEKYAYQILIEVKRWFKEQPSLADIAVPDGTKFTICGDIHGQFYDLLNIFELNGRPSPENPYLFNGDFVDRGSFSVECILTLFGFKLLYPDKFFMSRGNHETENMNSMYGFEGEVKAKYSDKMLKLYTDVFNWLPLCHCVANQMLVTHGGLFSEDGIKLDELRTIDRNRQPPDNGPMCDLLWSDPQPQPGRSMSKRGVGIQFGPDVTQRFLSDNKLNYVIRSHEVKQEGYEEMHDGKCITVFSAPNYCDTMGNQGAFITLEGGPNMKPKFTSFKWVEHPNVRPMAYANTGFLGGFM